MPFESDTAVTILLFGAIIFLFVLCILIVGLILLIKDLIQKNAFSKGKFKRNICYLFILVITSLIFIYVYEIDLKNAGGTDVAAGLVLFYYIYIPGFLSLIYVGLLIFDHNKREQSIQNDTLS